MNACNEYRMEINDEWLNHIIDGRKTIEGRKNNPASWGRLRVNDVIVAVPTGSGADYDGHRFRVVGIRYYSSVTKYLEAEGLEHCLPGVESIEEGVSIYMRWSTAEEITQYGFMAIELKPISS